MKGGFRELLVGLVLTAFGLVGIWYFLDEVLGVLLGFIPLVVLFFGALLVMIGVTAMREKSEEFENWEAESSEEGSE
ncbi:MAG: hypothetical protein ACP5E9_02130 [Candidatus Methanospirareceae archaeon]